MEGKKMGRGNENGKGGRGERWKWKGGDLKRKKMERSCTLHRGEVRWEKEEMEIVKRSKKKKGGRNGKGKKYMEIRQN